MLMFSFDNPIFWGVSTQVVWWIIPMAWKKWLMINLAPLSEQIALAFVSNFLSTDLTKPCKRDWVSALEDIGKTQTNLVWSSTIVRKYLWPCIEVVEQGPQISTCIKAKGEKEWELLTGKINFFCLALWQASQIISLTKFKWDNIVSWLTSFHWISVLICSAIYQWVFYYKNWST